MSVKDGLEYVNKSPPAYAIIDLRLEDGNDRYIQILKNNFPNDFNLKGMRIVLDCANGAGYKAALKLLKTSGISYDQIIRSIKNLASSKDTLEEYFNKVYKNIVSKKNNFRGIIASGLNFKREKIYNISLTLS